MTATPLLSIGMSSAMILRLSGCHVPKGVWTLPPSYALGDKDHAKYEAIGEADNFVLLFRKPADPK